MKKVTIYTDGACSGNPGPGGWGAVLIYGKTEKHISGGENETTNNRMELTAAIEGLNSLKSPCIVKLFTDSKYVMDGITKWVDGWIKNGWKNSQKKDVKNADLWKKLLDAVQRHEIEWNWVKGHSGDKYNDIADQLAVEATNKKIAK